MIEARAAALGTEIRRRLGPPPQQGQWPQVSIVVPNRDGADHLRRLVTGLDERTDYPDFELILVDNASGDDSLDFVRQAPASFPVAILANPHNESFSDACNMGAEQARGELLLMLNNDVEPLEPGWLRELVHCQRSTQAGIAGATLVRPNPDAEWGYRVQHRAIMISEEGGLLGPDRRSYGEEPFAEGFGEDVDSPVPTGACMLIERGLFQRVGGFTHGYLYGGEDVDLGLKVLAAGRRVLCSGRSMLIHRLGSTLSKESAERKAALAAGNRRLFWEIWGPRLRREYELDRLAGGGRWAAAGQPPADPTAHERALALSFCLKSSEPAPRPPTEDRLGLLGAELANRGHRCAVLYDGAEDLTALEYDVAVHLRGSARHIPVPGRLNVLWIPNRAEAAREVEAGRYDLILTGELAASNLVDAASARIEELGLPLRIEPQPA